MEIIKKGKLNIIQEDAQPYSTTNKIYEINDIYEVYQFDNGCYAIRHTNYIVKYSEDNGNTWITDVTNEDPALMSDFYIGVPFENIVNYLTNNGFKTFEWIEPLTNIVPAA